MMAVDRKDRRAALRRASELLRFNSYIGGKYRRFRTAARDASRGVVEFIGRDRGGSPEFSVDHKTGRVSCPLAEDDSIQSPATMLAWLLSREPALELRHVIAVRGPAFSGKSTLAGMLATAAEPAVVLPMAASLKSIATRMGWDGRKDERGRKLLQTLGTECGREYNPFCWANLWLSEPWYFREADTVICDDVRFPEELMVMNALALVAGAQLTCVHVCADAGVIEKRRRAIGAAKPNGHASETGGEALDALLRTKYFAVKPVRSMRVERFSPHGGGAGMLWNDIDFSRRTV
jgi:hypothetical protein